MGVYDTDMSTAGRAKASFWADRPQMPYMLPYFAFILIMLPGQYFGKWAGVDWEKLWFDYHPFVYTAKTLAGAVLLWHFRRYYTPIKWSYLWLGVIVGLLGVVEWVGVEWLSQILGLTRAPDWAKVYVPPERIPDLKWLILFYVIRVGGPTLVVPVMEELLFRDFLMRMLVRGARFQDVAVGTFSWLSLLGVAGLFAMTHIQWPSGFIYGLMMGILLVRTKSLGACIVAHGVTNLVLYLWCIAMGGWYWQFM